MRQIGTLSRAEEARRFADYLVASGIEAHAEEESEGWALWVREEEAVPRAREALEDFRRNPEEPRYRDARRKAEERRREELERREKAARNAVSMRGHWNRSFLQRAPLTAALIALCVVIFVASDFGADPVRNDVMRAMQFVDPIHLLEGRVPPEEEGLLAWSRLFDIRNGQVWRLLSPIFLHMGIIHLALNMLWLYQLGDQIEARRGTWRYAGLILLTAFPSVLLQSLVPAAWGGSPLGGGMSGVVFGLLGFLWMRMYFDPRGGLGVRSGLIMFMLLWLVLGMTPLMEGVFGVRVANWAHGVGLVMGMLCGALPYLLKLREPT